MTELALRRVGFEPAAPVLRRSEAEASAPAGALTLTLVDSLDGFDALAEEWDTLFAAAARPEHVFQSHAWCWHWARTYLDATSSRRTRLAIVTGRAEGRLVLIFPLVIERRFGLRQLAWLGAPVSQYGDVIADPTACQIGTLEAAWRFAVRATRADLANLRRVRADATVAPLLARLGATITAIEEAPYLDFARAGDFESYCQGLPSKTRAKNRRRQRRRLEERGSLSFERHRKTAEAGALARRAVEMKRAWLDERDRISFALADARFERFFSGFATDPGRQVACDVLALRSAGEIGALQIVLECKGVRFLHVAVYALAFEKLGAGAVLLEESLADCYALGLCRLDLLPPRHDYKMDFADGAVSVFDHALALSVRGRLYTHGALASRRRLKAAIERMPGPIRRLIARAIALAKRAR